MIDYLPNLKRCIKTGKLGQAKKLLSQIKERHSEEKYEVIQMVALASEKTAFELISFLTADQNRDPEIQERLLQLITDRTHLNFSFVTLLFDNADTATLKHLSPLLKHILSKETDKKLLSTVIRTAGKRKLEPLVDDLAEFIFYDDANLKLDAVNALERISSPHALARLEQSAQTEKCDQHILDAIQVLRSALIDKNKTAEAKPSPAPEPVKKTDSESIEIEGLYSPILEKRFGTFISLTRDGVNLSKSLSREDLFEHHDLVLNLLWLASRIIPVGCVNTIFNILNRPKLDNDIKFVAYHALESYPELESAAGVIPGLSESAMHVRLAAVKVLNKNLSDLVCAEIKSKIESGTKKGELLAQTILDARARNIIEYLMISDSFSYMASNYLTKTAPIPVVDTFIDILLQRNLKSTAKKYMDIRDQRIPKNQDPIIVVSSSEAILNIYSKLIFSCGLPCHTFLKTQEAFEAIVFQKPKAVLCDLFLKDLTGFDMAREIRDMYSPKEVPVIISTFQKSLDKDLMAEEMAAAQVDHLCEFPAKISQIKSWVK